MSKLTVLIERYNASGHVACHYPRKKRVALDGFPSISEADAMVKMQRVLEMQRCYYCGTNGEHYCPNDVAKD